MTERLQIASRSNAGGTTHAARNKTAVATRFLRANAARLSLLTIERPESELKILAGAFF